MGTINQTIQNTLNSLEKDCDSIEHLVDEAINKDNATRSANIKAWLKGGCLYLLALSLPLAIMVTLVLAMMEGLLTDLMGKELTDLMKWYTLPIKRFMASYPADAQMYGGLGLMVNLDTAGAGQVAGQDFINHDQETKEAAVGQTRICQECCKEQKENSVQ